jgi:hypothetical protein
MGHRIVRLVLSGVAGVAFCLIGMVPASSGAATPQPAGTSQAESYWLVAADGGVFSFGSANFYGSMGGMPLNAPIVGMAPSTDDAGYWLVAADGGVFTFGNAGFYGSMGGMPLNQPVVGMAATPDGKGYWLVGSDGGVFAFGDATYYDSLPGIGVHPNAPVVSITATTDGGGYYLAGQDGGVFTFGDAVFYGSFVNQQWQVPYITPAVVGLALNYGAPPVAPGYFVAASNGQGAGQPGSSSSETIAIDGPVVGFSAYFVVTGTGQVSERGTLPTVHDPGLTGVQLNAPVVGMFSFLA